ncbi:hypothetical protein ACFP4H_22215 [Pseudophaeobacter arcticus]|uniref:hypothetical protein n=1 Tax=Pseudophaeobacter arcticus TaxID=385492 RepID=UPI000422B8C9|nr:hypothetical protein [Pseudophaeobacter arcticus]
MISGIGSNFNISNLEASYKAGVPEMDASLNEGKTQGMDRAIQRERALRAAREASIFNLRAPQSAGPALKAARDKALGRGSYSADSLMAQFLAQASSHAPGPKSVSSLIAEDSYRAARSQAVAGVNGSSM